MERDRGYLTATHSRTCRRCARALGLSHQAWLSPALDRHLPAHPLHEGLSNGWLITVWITFILSQADHCKSHVRDWAADLHHTLESVTGQPFRPVDFTDDRLTLVLQRLSDPMVWARLEADLWQSTCNVYELPVERIRLDSTTSYGYHTVTEGGLMQLGHSKDHRPDLPQLKLMAAAAEPTGLLVASDVHPGDAADDPLYLPLIRRVRELLGQTGLLYTGDCKMAALETRAEIAVRGDFYLTRLPMTGEVAAQFAGWVEAALTGEAAGKLIEIRVEDDLLGQGMRSSGRRPRLSSLCSFRTLYFTPESGPAKEGFSCRGAVMNDEGNAARKIRKLRASRDLWKQRSAEKQQEIRQLRVTVRDLSSSRENWKTRVKELEQQLQAAHEAHAAVGPGSWIFFGGLMDNQAMPRTRRTPITLSSD